MKLLGFDYGASGGRCMLGTFDGAKLSLSELHRFENEPVWMGQHLRWDFPRLLHELKNGLRIARRAGHGDAVSLGINTWGVDFGLLDEYGELMGNPFHYRDQITAHTMEETDALVPRRELYDRTGLQFMHFNTLYQLLAIQKRYPRLYDRAHTLLFMPDLLGYFLTGEKKTEYSIASTSQMLDVRTRTWDGTLLDKLGLRAEMLTDIQPCGTPSGFLTTEVARETGLRPQLISVCGHDTASAVLAVPMRRGDQSAYLSCGTWSLLGVELTDPLTHAGAFEAQYTNEGGYGNTIRFLRNIMGQWIFNEIKREFEEREGPISYAEMDEQERAATPFGPLIDTDAPEFGQPGRMLDKINDFCARTGQPRPEGLGAVIRCVNESIALLYRYHIEKLEAVLGTTLPMLRVVGGGIRNRSLMRMTAAALERPVCAGPAEATAIGNITAQLLTLGELKNPWEARALVADSFDVQTYAPADAAQWREAYGRFTETVKGR